MIVYHGSDTYIDRIDLTKSHPNKDFGRGFYVTNIRGQADNMAARVADRSGKQPLVTEFEFFEYAFDEDEDCNVLRFESYNEAWLDFIVLNRDKKVKTNRHDYDIVECPVADDAVTMQIDNYLDGIIKKSDFLEELKFKRPTHQICFCTNRSLQYLKRKDAVPDGFYYNLDRTIVSQLILDRNLSEMEATDLFFSSGTYRKHIAENTEIDKKNWKEIYEILKKELRVESEKTTLNSPFSTLN